MAVEQRARQIRRRAAQIDALAFAELAIDHDAGHALQSLGDVLVGKLADILRRDRVDERRGVALRVDRLAQTRANAGDHDFFERVVLRGVVGLCRLLCLSLAVASEQRHGYRGTDQRRPSDAHKIPSPELLPISSRWWCCTEPLAVQYSTNIYKTLFLLRTTFTTDFASSQNK